jgi:hypothetical protein
MAKRADQLGIGRGQQTEGTTVGPWLPRPTLQFRVKAWRAFQRMLDPFAPPKPLRRPRKY